MNINKLHAWLTSDNSVFMISPLETDWVTMVSMGQLQGEHEGESGIFGRLGSC